MDGKGGKFRKYELRPSVHDGVAADSCGAFGKPFVFVKNGPRCVLLPDRETGLDESSARRWRWRWWFFES